MRSAHLQKAAASRTDGARTAGTKASAKTKAKTRGALLSGLRSGELHKAVDKMQADEAATTAGATAETAEAAVHRRSDAPDRETHLRESADPDAEVLDDVAEAGEAVQVLEEDVRQGMSRVRTVGGATGWVRSAHLQKAAASRTAGARTAGGSSTCGDTSHAQEAAGDAGKTEAAAIKEAVRQQKRAEKVIQKATRRTSEERPPDNVDVIAAVQREKEPASVAVPDADAAVAAQPAAMPIATEPGVQPEPNADDALLRGERTLDKATVPPASAVASALELLFRGAKLGIVFVEGRHVPRPTTLVCALQPTMPLRSLCLPCVLCVLRRSTPPRVESLVSGGEAAEQGDRVRAGMALTAVGARITAGMAYREVLALMRSAPRPLRLTFTAPIVESEAALAHELVIRGAKLGIVFVKGRRVPLPAAFKYMPAAAARICSLCLPCVLCVLRRSTPPRVESLVSGGEAAEQGDRVRAGMALTAVGARITAGMAYREVLALMRSAPRPLRLTFTLHNLQEDKDSDGGPGLAQHGQSECRPTVAVQQPARRGHWQAGDVAVQRERPGNDGERGLRGHPRDWEEHVLADEGRFRADGCGCCLLLARRRRRGGRNAVVGRGEDTVQSNIAGVAAPPSGTNGSVGSLAAAQTETETAYRESIAVSAALAAMSSSQWSHDFQEDEDPDTGPDSDSEVAAACRPPRLAALASCCCAITRRSASAEPPFTRILVCGRILIRRCRRHRATPTANLKAVLGWYCS